jgi:hypothetical protein
MEATPQAMQRKITLESLDLVQAQCPNFQLFNELLVQYPLPDDDGTHLGQVVPDNMVVLCDEPIKAVGSYDVPLQPVGPFWMLEYVSKSSKRKDYDDNMHKYEHELKVPYYLLFAPDAQEMTLYKHTGKKYRTVVPNGNGRCAMAEVDLEVALLDGWVRFWFRGELLPLSPEMLKKLQKAERELKRARREIKQKDEQLQQKDEQLQQVKRQTTKETQARLAAERLADAERQRAETLTAEIERLRQQLGRRGE